MIKNINKTNFNKTKDYYKDIGLNNKQIAKRLNISIRSFYYYKKGLITTRKTKNTISIKNKYAKIRAKIKPKPEPIQPKEIKFTIRCECIINLLGGSETEEYYDKSKDGYIHFFSKIEHPRTSKEKVLEMAKRQHDNNWKWHERLNIRISKIEKRY